MGGAASKAAGAAAAAAAAGALPVDELPAASSALSVRGPSVDAKGGGGPQETARDLVDETCRNLVCILQGFTASAAASAAPHGAELPLLSDIEDRGGAGELTLASLAALLDRVSSKCARAIETNDLVSDALRELHGFDADRGFASLDELNARFRLDLPDHVSGLQRRALAIRKLHRRLVHSLKDMHLCMHIAEAALHVLFMHVQHFIARRDAEERFASECRALLKPVQLQLMQLVDRLSRFASSQKPSPVFLETVLRLLSRRLQ
jgi:hypothetical protein